MLAGDAVENNPSNSNVENFVIYVDSHGLAIQANKDSVFRANAVTPEVDQLISNDGFLTGKSRGVTQSEEGSALSEDASIQERIIQYVEGSPFPRDSNFVGFKKIPHDALNTSIRTGRQTLKNEDSSIRIDEVNVKDMNSIDVEKVFSENLGRPPRNPIDVSGEVVVEGNVPKDKILTTIHLTKDQINKIKSSRKKEP